VPLAGLSTGHMVGLGVVAAIFIAFALCCSFLAPKRWPDFPGRQGLSVFAIACVALFAAQLAAVAVFGKESEAEAHAAGKATAAENAIKVSESEYKIVIPGGRHLSPGPYTFVVRNDGTIGHNLAVQGPGVSGAQTRLIGPGGTARLKVTLSNGKYTLYCAVPGHRELGMVTTLDVGG
jgi:plastocyanin